MFATAAKSAQEANLVNNQKLEDEGRQHLGKLSTKAFELFLWQDFCTCSRLRDKILNQIQRVDSIYDTDSDFILPTASR